MNKRKRGQRTGRVIAYLTGSYARATDTFIRDEVALLREAGDTVVTFSVRRPDDSEIINDAIAAERTATTDLVALGPGALVAATLVILVRHPRRFARAASLVRRLARPGVRGRMWPVFYLLEACALAVRLRRARVEHLHNHIGEGSASVAMLASVLSGIPYSLTVHGPSEWDQPHDLSLDLKARHAAFVATISEYTRGQMRRWISHEDWAKVHIVRCGVPAEATRRPIEDWPQQTTLVSVGRLAPAKGHLVLLESLRDLAGTVDTSGLSVEIVGDGPQRDLLEGFVREHGLDSVVDFVGWQTSEEVQRRLRSCTALVMPSFAEGLPVSIMEAYAAGRPVISSDVAAVSELVRPGESGWLVTPGSAPELGAALEELIAMTPAELAQYGAAGRERVRTRHDLATEVGHLRSLIHESPIR